MCTLDSTKAFYKVNLVLLLVKLKKIKKMIPLVLIDALYDYTFCDQKVHINWNSLD